MFDALYLIESNWFQASETSFMQLFRCQSQKVTISFSNMQLHLRTGKQGDFM